MSSIGKVVIACRRLDIGSPWNRDVIAVRIEAYVGAAAAGNSLWREAKPQIPPLFVFSGRFAHIVGP
jgi:hypothetical protein